ncbi:aminotransferase class I/II-fold pyridoxal phosphate-dependent enzyme [Coxiella burnetii]|uniref:aminotransferase class I/II-fold pyridoxal phosphate-dependent enzyme n=1 Tax=Coxiella burnetii TaxID=777 RepID=UPI0000ECFF2B|nr:8-amino-7-oxononanoate synthase [Coxiella burnetii]ACJ20075.1 8-amino-7-oxononanoate synthase [Coxiella burnetii CbuK_Q154]EAX33754.1 8-amino-7-oxononanoate synthase [Coxiella burnetii 'MSU Goat Q177']UYK70588.1 8-amino-7-oxononanoate synthase [Coxiella burnetii]
MLATDIKNKLQRHTQSALLRKRIVVAKRKEAWVNINGRDCINFCSNDYLGLASHPAVKAAFIRGIQQYGAGSGSSALISGYFKPQQMLEEKFAAFLNRDRAIFFNSGYLANLGVMTSLADRKQIIFSDKLCHASLLDAIQLSRAKHYRYPHQNFEQLKFLMSSKRAHFLLTEGIFSMEGDITPLPSIIDLISAKDILLIVDDAHGIGVLGKNGGGICEYWNLTQTELPCLITPLGKAFGCAGAVVSGRSDLVEAVLQFSRSYRNTTALPPALALAILQSLEIIQTETWRREKLTALSQTFIQYSKKNGLKLISDDPTPIKCLQVSDNKKTQIIQEALINFGFFVSCIRPPSVPAGSARIRISLGCFHTETQIVQLLDRLASLLC